jgi:hypothetical protein
MHEIENNVDLDQFHHDLSIGIMIKAKGTRKNTSQKNVLELTYIFTSIGKCKGSEFQAFPSENHFGNWNPKTFRIFGTIV